MLAALPPIIQVLVFNGFYNALLVLAGYSLINLVWQYPLFLTNYGTWFRPFNLSGIFVVNFLGLAISPVGMLLSFVNHHCQNRSSNNSPPAAGRRPALSDLNKR